MIRKHMWMSAICISAAFFALQCGDEGDEGNDTSDTEDSENESDTGGGDMVTGTLQVPDSFDGTPTIFATMYLDDLDTTAMPKAFGDVINHPEITAGSSFEFTTTQAGLEGEYYLTVVVYCEGGGNGMFPKSGVDWVGAAGPLTLGPGTGDVDAGEMMLIPTP